MARPESGYVPGPPEEPEPEDRFAQKDGPVHIKRKNGRKVDLIVPAETHERVWNDQYNRKNFPARGIKGQKR